MTLIEEAARVCVSCAAPLRAGARFCVGCGASVPEAPAIPAPRRAGTVAPASPMTPPIPAPRAGGPGLAPRRPVPTVVQPPAIPSGAVPVTPAPNRGSSSLPGLGWLAAAVVVAVVAVVGVSVGGALATRASSTPAEAPVPSAPRVVSPTAGSATPGSASPDPLQQLQAQRRADAASAETTVGSWIPQLSSKKVGMPADGVRYDDAAILADHQRLRTRYSGVFLVWSGDFTSFKSGDFWITLVDQPFDTAQGANQWCETTGLDADHCYAKRLSHTGGPAGNTALRNGAGG